MNDDTDEAYKRGVRDTRIESLENRIKRLEIIAKSIGGAIAAAWAKLVGFW